MQRRAQIGLNKGEAHHALKNALRIGRQGKFAIARQRAALPNRWAQFIDCGDHLLEYRPSWSCRHGAAERRVGCSPNFFPTYPHWAGRTFY